MEPLIFLFIWLGGASVHTLLELNTGDGESDPIFAQRKNTKKRERTKKE